MERPIKDALIGAGATAVFEKIKDFMSPKTSGVTSEGFTLKGSGVTKKPGETLNVRFDITNGTNGISQNYGVGLSIMDAKGVVWDAVSAFVLEKSPGSRISSYQINAGQTITANYSLTIPSDIAVGDGQIRISVWKESTLPVSTRLADTGWLPSQFTVPTPQQYNISIKNIVVS